MVECEFSHSGCTEKIRRKDTARHMEENTQKHLVMVSTSMMSMMNLLQEKDQQIKEQQQQIDALQVKVWSLENHIHKFTMTEFQKHKTNRSSWTSPSFYTHPGGIGYRICGLCVDPQHTHDHIKVWMNVAKGDFDDQLQWPRACTITIQLLNQLGDHNHFTKRVRGVFRWSLNFLGLLTTVWRDGTFIAHSDLGYKADRNTQYLKDDCLLFRIVSIDLK